MSRRTGVAVLSARRTPMGRQRGALSGWRVDDLAAAAIRAAVGDLGDPSPVEEIACGMVNASGEAMGNPGRFAALLAGLPDSVSGFTVNRYCGSGLTAMGLLASSIAFGAHRGGVAVGAESMSRPTWPIPIPLSTTGSEPVVGRNSMFSGAGGPQHPRLEAEGAMIDMAPAAQLIADAFGVSRAEMDQFALDSHRRAASAQDAGRFVEEIFAVEGPSGALAEDETIRRDSTAERLARLNPFHAEARDITAGNASPVNDGASALALADPAAMDGSAAPPLGYLVGYTSIGVAPRDFAHGPVLAVRRLLGQHGLSVADVDLFEINEAFAAQMVANMRALDLDPERVNVNGGALALGHALGNSGTRIVVTLLHEMRRRNVELGMAALCVGAGQAVAALFRRAQ